MYIWGKRFKLRTDHKPLVKVLTPGGAEKVTSRLIRLAARSQEYNYTVEYIPGWRNVQADCLSRLSQDWEMLDEEYGSIQACEDLVASVGDVVQWSSGALSKEEWCQAMACDEEMREVINMIVSGRRRESTLPKNL
ncbi:hypothetical protein NDU88_007561, partial [Pleurodeles waltl]